MAWELRHEINPSVLLFFGQCFPSTSEEQTRTEIGTEEWDMAVMDLTVAVWGEELWEEFHKLLQETGRKLAELNEPGKASQ